MWILYQFILIVALLIVVVMYYRILNAIRRDIKTECRSMRERIDKLIDAEGDSE